MSKAVIAAIILIASIALAFGGVGDYYGSTIISLQLSTEVTGADSLLVYNSSGLKPGQILTAGKVQDAVKKIYALGLFSEVRIIAQPAERGVDVTIQLESYSRLSKIKFKGNNKFKTKKLLKEITIGEGRIVSPGAIKSNIELIKKLYEEKGYLNVKIDTAIEPDKDEPDKSVLIFKISEGRKIKVRRIDFVGNRFFEDKKLRSKISTKQKSLFRTGNFDKEKFKEDKQKLVDFYKNEGYIDAVVTADTIMYGNISTMKLSEFSDTAYTNASDLYIKMYVDEGRRYYFGKFSWDGNDILKSEQIANVFSVKEGDHYSQEKYDEMLAKLYEAYQDEGYWYVQIDEKKTPRERILDVNYSITEGKPVYVRLINIEGNTKTQDKVIRRELKVKPNTVFKRSVLGRSIREVMVLNFFSNITPDWKILDNGDIDLILKAEEKATGQFSIGAGYSASDNFVGTIGLGIPNFKGGGQTVSINADIGSSRTTFSLGYTEPWLFDTPTSLSSSIYFQEREYSDYFTEGRKGGSVQVGRRLRWPDNYFKVYAGYLLEQLKYYDISDDYIESSEDNEYSVDKYDWPLWTSAISLTIERDSRDLVQFTTSGSDFYWTGELGGTFLGGDWDYHKHVFVAEHYFTPIWKLTFSLHGKWGFVQGIYDRDDDVPYAERFTPGGTDTDGTIRGYDDAMVGPLSDDDEYNKGGRSLAVYNLEMLIPIVDQQFYALLFADAGNAWLIGDEFREYFYRPDKLKKSIGFGFRIQAPMIGIIGFDFGYPLNGDDRGLKPHFQIGAGF